MALFRFARPLRATLLARHRFFSSASAQDDLPTIYRSRCTKPWNNLAFEDWMFRQWDPSRPSTLILWQNEPSVVIGRNQSPWTECNVLDMARDGVHFVRRRSGGGTVFHDAGNINLTFMTSRERYEKTRYTHMIAQALQQDFGIAAKVNDRNDITLNGDKISGSAYKLGGKAAYHHCTLLVSSDIPTVRKYLRPCRTGMVSKGVESVRSPVRTLSSVHPGITVDEVFASISRAFSGPLTPKFVEVDPTDMTQHPELLPFYEDLTSWEWAFGQTPIFTQTISQTFSWGTETLEIECRKGRIRTVTTDGSSPIADKHHKLIAEALVDVRYGVSSDAELALAEVLRHSASPGPDPQLEELCNWLTKAL